MKPEFTNCKYINFHEWLVTPSEFGSYEFKDASRRCASTGTSNGKISINQGSEDEWLSYEILTQATIAGLNQNVFKNQYVNPENNFTASLQRKSTNATEEKDTNRANKPHEKEQKKLMETISNYENIFDVHAAGDRRDYVSLLPMRKSLFPCVAPYILFHGHDCNCTNALPKSVTQLLKWKFTESMPRVLIKILLNSGYQLILQGSDWSAIWNGSFGDLSKYRHIKCFQKVNSIPGSHNLGNKDVLWTHLNEMRTKFGPKEFDFMPSTYVLPRDMQKFRSMWQRHGAGCTWIVKPPSSGRGQGIKVINQWWEIPKWHSVVVQRYISKPRLINGSKFDLRIYVLLTSVNPTRIYVYQDGLVRFASSRYVPGTANLNDKYMHLTNTSVNKQNPNYVINNGVNAFRGHKWSLKNLWSHFKGEQVDVAELWSKIKDIVVKTIICAEAAMNNSISENITSNYTCYELYGFDILLDENYKPWLLEANVLPSLQTDSPIDLAIKGPLVRNVLNLAGYQIPDNKNTSGCPECSNRYESALHNCKLYSTTLSLSERIKQNKINAVQSRGEYLGSILEELTGDDVRQLIRYEDEFSQAGYFEKIFPTKRSYEYLKFFETERYYDRLLDAWEHRYSDERENAIQRLTELCEQEEKN